jgi:hypothetical protein
MAPPMCLAKKAPQCQHPQGLLDEMGTKLERFKDNFREKVKSLLDSFLKDVTGLCDDFAREAPFTAEVVTSDAVAYITDTKTAVEATRKRANEIKSGMDIFNIPQVRCWRGFGGRRSQCAQAPGLRQDTGTHLAQLLARGASSGWGCWECGNELLAAHADLASSGPQPAYKDLAAMEKELELLDKIWSQKAEWEGLYSGWKDGSFADIRVRAGAAAPAGQRVSFLR